MIIFLIRAAIYIGTAALGLFVTSLILPDFTLMWSGFFVAVVVFALTNSILTPFIFRMTNRYAPMALGGIGLLSTLAALIVAQFLSNGLHISGFVTWVLASLIVWVVTTLGAWLLPMLFLKKRLATRAAQSKSRLLNK